MPVFNNTDDLVKHVITKTWNNDVPYTPKELGFPNNTPNASKKKTSANSLFAVKITDTDRREKYERGIGGAIVDKIIDDALKNGFTINIISTPEEPEKALTKTLTRIYKEKIELELGKALKWARLYGYNFLLMGRKDGQDLDTPLSNKSAKVEYTKAILRNWITEIVYKKDEGDTG